MSTKWVGPFRTEDLEDNFYLPNSGDDDVVSFGSNVFKIGRFREAVRQAFKVRYQVHCIMPYHLNMGLMGWFVKA